MFNALVLIVAMQASGAAWQVTPADVDRCVISNVQKLSGSGDFPWDIANKAVVACDGMIGQLTAARDALAAKDTGRSVPLWNSEEWRATVTKSFWQSALRDVDRAQRTH